MHEKSSGKAIALPRSIRRSAAVFLVALALLTAFTLQALQALEKTGASSSTGKETRHHALSLIGTPRYSAGFQHFDYVNPRAPKGGRARLAATGSFDTLNLFTNKGDPARGLGLIYDSLMDQSLDQPSTSYCLLCEWVSYPEDFSSVTFKLRPQARWHDGKPITPEDVIFSFNSFTAHHPFYKFYYKNVKSVEKTGPGLVTFRFAVRHNRELPQIMGDLAIMPRHYWTGNNDRGEKRDPGRSTLEPPLGSGPYRIRSLKGGDNIIYERVKDYWAQDLPVRSGQYNFDEISYTYFRDDTVALESFKSGRLDFRQETSSKNWASAYDFPAFKKGLVKKQLVTLKTAEPMQAFVLNTRRNKYQNRDVRQAFNLAFDFEWANKNLFYGQYKRVSSYFQNTELASSGLPQGKELEILEEIRDLVPQEVFTTPFSLPVNKTPRDFRKHLRQAAALLDRAGWKISGRQRVNEKTGEVLSAEFLLVSPAFERIVLPYTQALAKLGIKTSVRLVDSSQYVRRLRSFDFDIVIGTFRQSQSPGNEQRDFWSSAAADKQGSRNLIGIKDKGIDRLIDKIIFAKSRADLVAATRALDRVLLWNKFVVPQWYAPFERIAYWNRFGQPATLPTQGVGFLATWWVDPQKAKALEKTGK